MLRKPLVSRVHLGQSSAFQNVHSVKSVRSVCKGGGRSTYSRQTTWHLADSSSTRRFISHAAGAAGPLEADISPDVLSYTAVTDVLQFKDVELKCLAEVLGGSFYAQHAGLEDEEMATSWTAQIGKVTYSMQLLSHLLLVHHGLMPTSRSMTVLASATSASQVSCGHALTRQAKRSHQNTLQGRSGSFNRVFL